MSSSDTPPDKLHRDDQDRAKRTDVGVANTNPGKTARTETSPRGGSALNAMKRFGSLALSNVRPSGAGADEAMALFREVNQGEESKESEGDESTDDANVATKPQHVSDEESESDAGDAEEAKVEVAPVKAPTKGAKGSKASKAGKPRGFDIRGALGGVLGDAIGGVVGDKVGGAVEEKVSDAIGGRTGEIVGGVVGDKVGETVGDAVGGAVTSAIQGKRPGDGEGGVEAKDGHEVEGKESDTEGAAPEDGKRGVPQIVGGLVGDVVGGLVGDKVGGAVEGKVSQAIGGQVGQVIGGQVGGVVGDKVGETVGGAVEGAVTAALTGGGQTPSTEAAPVETVKLFSEMADAAEGPRDGAGGNPPGGGPDEDKSGGNVGGGNVGGGNVGGGPSAVGRNEAMRLFTEVNGNLGPSAEGASEAMALFRAASGRGVPSPEGAAEANQLFHEANTNVGNVGGNVNVRPSAAGRHEANQLFREVNGTAGPSAAGRDEAMQLFRAANGGGDVTSSAAVQHSEFGAAVQTVAPQLDSQDLLGGGLLQAGGFGFGQGLANMAGLDELDGDAANTVDGEGATRVLGDEVTGLEQQVSADPGQAGRARGQLRAALHREQGALQRTTTARAQRAGATGSQRAGHTASRGAARTGAIQSQRGQRTDATRAGGVAKKAHKAKSIAELRARLEDSFKTKDAELKAQTDAQRADLTAKLAAERTKLDTEIKAQLAKVTAEAATRKQGIETQTATKKQALEAKSAAEAKRAEAATHAEQAKLRTTAASEVAKIEAQGKAEADKVKRSGSAEASSARSRGNREAQAAIARGEAAASKTTGDNASQQAAAARARAQREASSIRAKAATEAKSAVERAQAEAERRAQTTRTKAEQARAKGEASVAEQDAKLVATQAKITRDAADGVAQLEAEKAKLQTELQLATDAGTREAQRKATEGTAKLAQQEKDALAKITAIEATTRTSNQAQRDGVLLKLETGSARDLARLEEETTRAIGEIDKATTSAQAQVTAEVTAAHAQATKDTQERIAAVKAEGDKAMAALQAKAADAERRLDAVAKAAQDRLAASVDQHEKDAQATGAARTHELTQLGDKSVEDLKKSSADYDKQQAAEAAAAAKAKAAEEAKKAAEEKQAAEAAAKKVADEKRQQEERDRRVDSALSAIMAETNATFYSDDKAILAALKGRSPEEIALIKAKYQERNGKSLDEAITKNMSGGELATAKAMLQGPAAVDAKVAELASSKDVKDSASAIFAATQRWGTDERAISDALKGKSPEQTAAIKEAFRSHYGMDLDTVLEQEMGGTELKEAKALMSADPVKAAVAQLHNASDGLGTDTDKILAVLKDIKDPKVRAEVAKQYQADTKESLDDMLKGELSGADKDKAEAYLAGDEKKVAAIEADVAINGGFITSIVDATADMTGVDRKTMRGAATTATFGIAGLGTDENALYSAMETLKPEDRAAFKIEYERRTGKSFDATLATELTDKERDVTTAIMKGDKVGASAAKMAAAADGLGTDRKAIYDQLEKAGSKEERDAIIARFNNQYGTEYKSKDGKSGFEQMMSEELDSLDAEKGKQLAASGKMNDGFALYYAMNEGFMGIGTDDALLKERLQGKDKKDIERLRAEYAAAAEKFGGTKGASLDTDVMGETSGREGHALRQALKGNPETLEEMRLRAQEDYEFERKSSGWIGEVGMAVMLGPITGPAAKLAGVQPHDLSNALTDSWSDSGKQLDRTNSEMNAKYEALKKDPRFAGFEQLPKDSPQRKEMERQMMAELQGTVDWQSGDLKGFEAAKDATADVASTAVTIAVGAVVTVVSGGTAAPAVVALLSGLAGVSTKMIIAGASMSNETLVTEVASVLAEVAAMGVVKIGRVNRFLEAVQRVAGGEQKLIARLLKEACEEAIESGSEELFNALADPALYKGDLADFVAGASSRFGKAVFTGAVAGTVSGVANDLMAGTPKLGPDGKPIPDRWTTKAAKGATSQVAGTVATTVIDPASYEGSVEEKWVRFGRSAGEAALTGARDSLGSDSGQHVDPTTTTTTTTTAHVDTSAGTDTKASTRTDATGPHAETTTAVDTHAETASPSAETQTAAEVKAAEVKAAEAQIAAAEAQKHAAAAEAQRKHEEALAYAQLKAEADAKKQAETEAAWAEFKQQAAEAEAQQRSEEAQLHEQREATLEAEKKASEDALWADHPQTQEAIKRQQIEAAWAEQKAQQAAAQAAADAKIAAESALAYDLKRAAEAVARKADMEAGFQQLSTEQGPRDTSLDTRSTETAVDGKTPEQKAAAAKRLTELVAFATEAHKEYATKIGPAKALLASIIGPHGEVQGRAKDPESAANRLQRAEDNFGAKITDAKSAADNLWDALGTRVVIKGGTYDVKMVIARLAEAAAAGQFEIIKGASNHGDGVAPYMSQSDLDALNKASGGKADTEGGLKKGDADKSAFTSGLIFVRYPDGSRGEIQIIGPKVLEVAAIEHIPYDLSINKPLARGMDEVHLEAVRMAAAPVEQAIKGLAAEPERKAAYEQYLRDLYKHARNAELGIDSAKPTLPAGINEVLSESGLREVYDQIERIKAHAKAEQQAQGGETAPVVAAATTTDTGDSKQAPAADTWSDTERQTEKPNETAEAAQERRSKGVTPTLPGADGSKWANPSDRKGVSEHVPLSRQSLRDLIMSRYAETLSKHAGNVDNADLAGHPDFQPLLDELRAIPPGSLKNNKEALKAYETKWAAIAEQVSLKTGTGQTELRELYNIVEHDDFRAWMGHVSHLPLEQQAKLAHMWRQELRILIRDLMNDASSKEILYLRDRAMSGDRRGPLFEDLLRKNLKEPNTDIDEALRGVIGSSQRSNANINEKVTGSSNGVGDLASSIRESRVENLDDQRARLDLLSAKARNGTEEQKQAAQAELAELQANPEWQAAIAKHKVLDNLFATLATTTEQVKKKQETPDVGVLSEHIGNVLAGQDAARAAYNPALQAKRERFERAVALAILKDGPVRQAIDTELSVLCAKALDYVMKTRTEAGAQDAVLANLHTEQSKGYGGGLKVADSTTEQNAALMKEVFASGNIRERMQALSNFMELIGSDALTSEGRAKLDEMAAQGGDGQDKTTFSAADAKALVERVTQLDTDLADKSAKARDTKTLFNPNSTESGADEAHGAFADAKGQDMDTKLPPLIADKVNEFLGQEIAKSGTIVAGAEKSPLVRTTITVREAIGKGLQLSPREIAAAGGYEGKLNWVIGLRANMVKADAPFIKTAKATSMPLKAGISGTTFRWMRLVDMLGGNPDLARLAAVASLQAADAHSYHEIAFAAQGFGATYDPNKPYASMGIDEAILKNIAASVGTTLDELNKNSDPEADRLKAEEDKRKRKAAPAGGGGK